MDAHAMPSLGYGLRHDSNPTKLGLMDCAGLADAYLIGMSEGPNFDAAMERRFQEYVEDLGTVVGNDARRRGLSDYMTGLLLPGERKSMEPIAERLESGNVSRRHQSIQHFVSEASWKDGPVRERVLGRVVPAMQKRGTIEHWIVDDTTLLKSGRHGVAIQYSGLVGTTASRWSACRWRPRPSACRSPAISTCPRTDRKRRLHAGVPPHLTFRTKIEMAIDQIRHAVAAGLPRGIVLADAAYGGARRFRDALRDLALSYALGIESNTTVVPTADPANGRTRSVKVQAGAVRVDVLASAWEPHHWRPVSWREGSAGQLSGRFAARRVQVAPTQRRDHLDPEEWLIVQDAEAAKDRRFWLSSLPADTPLEDLVRHVKGRYRVEQDYRELKQEVGLAKFEGRGWRGFNHHVTLCLAAYGFLVCERSLFPPPRPAEADTDGAAQSILHRLATSPHRPHDHA
jgi:SRSO17 transposase